MSFRGLLKRTRTRAGARSRRPSRTLTRASATRAGEFLARCWGLQRATRAAKAAPAEKRVNFPDGSGLITRREHRRGRRSRRVSRATRRRSPRAGPPRPELFRRCPEHRRPSVSLHGPHGGATADFAHREPTAAAQGRDELRTVRQTDGHEMMIELASGMRRTLLSVAFAVALIPND